MKLKQTLFSHNSLYIFLMLISVIALLPFIIATFYLHPNVDDLFFSKSISDLGTFGFVSHFYQTWSGRFFASFLMGSIKADPIKSGYFYTIMPLFFMLATWYGIFRIAYLFLKDVLDKWKVIVLTTFFFSFYITGLNEIFSALYWYCSSYYLLLNVFFLLFLYEIANYFINSYKIKSFSFIKVLILSFLLCGLSEVYIISLIIGSTSILIYHYSKSKKLKLDIIILLIAVIIGSYLNLFSPGALNRLNTESTNSPEFIKSAIRAVYDLLILQISPLLYSGLLILCFVVLTKGQLIIENSVKLRQFFKVNPLYSIITVLFIFYLHHAMSLYGAGYVLQGRVINITNLLLYFSLFFIVMNIISYYNICISGVKSIYILTILLIISTSINFSKNSRIVGKDIFYNLPKFDQEMELRYQTILNAKLNNESTVSIERISVPLKSLDNNIYFNPQRTYYNSTLYCRDASTFFNIEVIISDDNYDSLDLEEDQSKSI